VPVPLRVELDELVVMPVRPESELETEEEAVIVREDAAAACSAGIAAPVGASPQRSQKPWSIVPPQPGDVHFSMAMIRSQTIHKKSTRLAGGLARRFLLMRPQQTASKLAG